MHVLLIPAAVAALVFLVFLLLLTRHISSQEGRRIKSLLNRVAEDRRSGAVLDPEEASLLKSDNTLLPNTGMLGFVSRIPGVQSSYDLLLKSGLGNKTGLFFLWTYVGFIVLIFVFFYLGTTHPFWLCILPLTLTVFFARRYLKRRITKRNERFLLLFPDAVDMIVRSVRSGHPLNTAIRMISENMENPVREEFKQVVDEVSYGRTLPEALQRLATRIGEQDLQFFVVVLSVQQETGGSLAEVLTNLSTIIRKRRQLRLKIRALTSEGRATSYILGALPFIEFGALQYVTPNYLDTLFTSGMIGYVIFGSAVAMIFLAMWIVRRMADIEI